MGRWWLGARAGALFVVWCVLAGLGGLWGWRLAAAHGPVPGGCGCLNPAALPVAIGWGLVGALVGVALVSAALATAGLGLYVRARRHAGTLEGTEEGTGRRADLDAWLSDVPEADVPV